MPEADEEGVVVVPRDLQDECLDNTLVTEELLHVHKDSPSQRKAVAMKTSDSHFRQDWHTTEINAALSNWR